MTCYDCRKPGKFTNKFVGKHKQVYTVCDICILNYTEGEPNFELIEKNQ